MIDENRRFSIPGVIRAKDFLNNPRMMPRLAGILTTNYDMLVEYAFGTKGFNYGVLNQPLYGRGPYPVYVWNRGPVRLTGEVPLVKLHGSINWDNNMYYTDGRRGLTGHANIVPPIPEKKPPKSLEFHWQTAEKVLKQTTRLLVFGFGFNHYDEAIRDLLKKAGQNINSVLLVNRSSKQESARELWPSADISWSLPPPEGQEQIRKWLWSK